MSKKSVDKKNRNRSVYVGFRMSPEEKAQLDRFVALSGLTEREYICNRALQLDVKVVPSPRVYKALKGQMEEIASELKRFESSYEMSSEFIELMEYTIRIYEELRGHEPTERFEEAV